MKSLQKIAHHLTWACLEGLFLRRYTRCKEQQVSPMLRTAQHEGFNAFCESHVFTQSCFWKAHHLCKNSGLAPFPREAQSSELLLKQKPNKDNFYFSFTASTSVLWGACSYSKSNGHEINLFVVRRMKRLQRLVNTLPVKTTSTSKVCSSRSNSAAVVFLLKH